MKVVGIIAEYNPFHNGHAYQINEIRKRTQADYIVVAMSGDFVQRGTPAMLDKYARTRMALCCGADFVFELPVLWATASAEAFAMAGVTLFEKMGCVDSLCFGAETDKLPLLTAIADILTEEPESYRLSLASYLKEGLNFPLARTKALCDYLATCPMDGRTEDAMLISSILSTPNNILAIEYLKALKRLHSSIEPLLLKREGAGYHDAAIHKDEPQAPAASATAIRKLLSTGKGFLALPAKDFDQLKCAMPSAAFHILADYLSCNPPIYADDFSSLLGYQLLQLAKEDFSVIYDITPDIANRMRNNLYHYCSFEQFCEQNKSREITYTRISRILLHLLLGITNDTFQLGCRLDYVPYLRMLGFRKDAAALLAILKKNAAIPMLSKLSDSPKQLSDDAFRLLEKDIFAADLYEQQKAIKKGTISRSEYTQEIVRV